MIDPLVEFASAGADSPDVAAAVEADQAAAFTAAQQAFATFAQSVEEFADALRDLFAPLVEAVRQLVTAIAAWVRRHWPATRAILGPSYRPYTIMRRKIRRYYMQARN